MGIKQRLSPNQVRVMMQVEEQSSIQIQWPFSPLTSWQLSGGGATYLRTLSLPGTLYPIPSDPCLLKGASLLRNNTLTSIFRYVPSYWILSPHNCQYVGWAV